MPTASTHNVNINELRIPLDELPVALANRIDREKRVELEALHPGLAAILRLTTSVSAATYQSIRFLAIDRAGDFGPRLDFAVAVPPLSRTLIDSIFTIVFLFDSPAANTRWFFASGWREANEYQANLVARHGADQDWDQWIADHAAWLAGLQSDAGITAAELANPKSIPWWPNPGKMLSRKPQLLSDPTRRDFLQFLDDWYYGALSGDSHLSYLGLARRGGFMWDKADSEMRKRYREVAVLTAVTLFVCLLSEIAAHVQLREEMRRLRTIWDVLRPGTDPGELWSRRYDELLRT